MAAEKLHADLAPELESATPFLPFLPRTLEFIETQQHLVVEKLTHVIEDVVVTRKQSTRTEQIGTTLHRTGVAIEPT